MGDCSDFGLGRQIEQIMHGLRSIDGSVPFTYWHGPDTYRLTVESTAMPYYILKAEVLTRNIDNNGQFVWKERNQVRRIWKSKIHSMILEGSIIRSKS